tara:strand:+ start:892 stop:1125 length:234 start_codon:yes stop_codon:yes gene_type:complete
METSFKPIPEHHGPPSAKVGDLVRMSPEARPHYNDGVGTVLSVRVVPFAMPPTYEVLWSNGKIQCEFDDELIVISKA